MENKKRKLLEEVDGGVPGGGGGDSSVVQRYIAPFSPAEAAQLLEDMCTQLPAAFELLRARADASLNHRKVFVRGLAWSTSAEDLSAVLKKHGTILETAIMKDKATGVRTRLQFPADIISTI